MPESPWIRFSRRRPASIRSWLRSSWPLNPAKRRAPAIPVTRAPTRTPSAGRAPAPRCRHRTIRAWCSSACSATAAAPDPKERLGLMREQKSILDSVTRGGGASCRARFRKATARSSPSISTRSAAWSGGFRSPKPTTQEVPLVEHPAGIPANWEDHVKLMLDLQVLAYQTDLTRVITLMMGHEQSGMTYPQIGVPDAHHPISHHQHEPEKDREDRQDQRVSRDDVCVSCSISCGPLPTATDTLLDHMTLIYGAGIADSNTPRAGRYSLHSGRRRRGQSEGRTAHASQGRAAGESAPDADGSVRRPLGSHRGQHGKSGSADSFEWLSERGKMNMRCKLLCLAVSRFLLSACRLPPTCG